MMGENAKAKCFKKPKTEDNSGRILRNKFAEAAVENLTENDLMERNEENNNYLLDHEYCKYVTITYWNLLLFWEDIFKKTQSPTLISFFVF